MPSEEFVLHAQNSIVLSLPLSKSRRQESVGDGAFCPRRYSKSVEGYVVRGKKNKDFVYMIGKIKMIIKRPVLGTTAISI